MAVMVLKTSTSYTCRPVSPEWHLTVAAAARTHFSWLSWSLKDICPLQPQTSICACIFFRRPRSMRSAMANRRRAPAIPPLCATWVLQWLRGEDVQSEVCLLRAWAIFSWKAGNTQCFISMSEEVKKKSHLWHLIGIFFKLTPHVCLTLSSLIFVSALMVAACRAEERVMLLCAHCSDLWMYLGRVSFDLTGLNGSVSLCSNIWTFTLSPAAVKELPFLRTSWIQTPVPEP